MRRALLAALLLNALMLAIRVTQEATAQVAMPPGTGDANGDGEIDLSDPIYLLRYLFESGAPPAACADSPAILERLTQLESSVASLGADVETSAKDFALVAHGRNQLVAWYRVECSSAEQGSYKTGQGFFQPSAELLIRGGELSEDSFAIRFETDRQADLLFEFDLENVQGPGGVFSICMMLDGIEDANFLECLGTDGGPVTRRNVSVDVPPGPHTLQVRGSLQCRALGANATLATISYVAVQYLD